MHLTPWNEIRALIDAGARVVSVTCTREGGPHGQMLDSELKLWMPDGVQVRFKPSEFAIERACEMMRALEEG